MNRSISLGSLCESTRLTAVGISVEDVQVTKITADSRTVVPGTLFVACQGDIFDGHEFINKAVESGAVAVVGEKEIGGLPVPYFRVDNSRKKLAYLASAFYGFPSRKLVMIGVTGTDGKTTTVNLMFKILEAAGLKVGMISTVNAVIGDQVLDTGFHVTTPDAPEVQKYLSMMVEAGITHVVLETTSHGWSQYRVDACDFDIGIITNVTHEHLDQHGSYDNYLAVKGRLFQSLSTTAEKNKRLPKLAVLNTDDNSFDYLKKITKVDTISYGKNDSSDYVVKDIVIDASGIQFDIFHENMVFSGIRSSLIGDYNALNITAAFSASVQGLELDPEVVKQGIAALTNIPGRMERIDCGQDFTAMVDFAHTPNALKNALITAKQITNGKVIAVFGSAGLRDREKRRMMAEVSSSLADISIFTAEDPRSESLRSILDQMEVGAVEKGGIKGETFWSIPDRREAIRKGIQLSTSGDLLIICGKGHEQSMCFGMTEYPWDDRTALRSALSEYMKIPGPEMPFLPDEES